MSNPVGRIIRVVAGIIIALAGVFFLHGIGRDVLIAVGAIVFLAGALNFCLFAPLFGAPFLGKDLQ